ncbi:hypothetical protein [Psychroserpens sp. S379A]|uniref:hypothetical protein n=1 Tax=Psychroserpens sp. S379A TaxID=3415137 RepID=UPI003C7BA9C7
MSKKYCCATFILFLFVAFYTSCQKDNYEEPELIPKTYSFSIPNKISFNFSQLSQNRQSLSPYNNTLTLKNISEIDFSGEYAVFAFKDMNQNFNNISFVKHGSFNEILINTFSDSIYLEASNNLFAENNLIAAILNFGSTESNHTLNGYYSGELNIFSPALDDNSQHIFLSSITCIGIIDYQGKFYFFIQNIDEQSIVSLKGNFNSENLISGSILNINQSVFSQLTNIAEEPFQLNENNFIGSVLFTDNTETRLLKFNLTKQN